MKSTAAFCLLLSAAAAVGVIAALILGATLEQLLIPVLAVSIALLLAGRRRDG